MRTGRRITRRGILVLLVLVTTACERSREPLGRTTCISWKQDLSAVFFDRCVRCHGDDRAEGNYRLTDYVEALAGGTDDVPNIISKDAASRLLTVLDEDETHRAHTDLRSDLSRWIVDCDARFVTTELHAPGIMNVSADGFHGELIKELAYDFDTCARCHGSNFSGGTAESSCLPCHPAGPKDCSTCHSDVAEQGQHRLHLEGGDLERTYECAVCHEVPERVGAVGHVLDAAGEMDPPPAEVVFSGPAQFDPVPGGREGPAAYDAERGACVNVYCHGDTLGADAAARATEPLWTASAEGGCTGCHGRPPADHLTDLNGAAPRTECQWCHPGITSGPERIVDVARHLDGVIQVGSSVAPCVGCHGESGLGAPPADLDGMVSTATVTVGAHAVHLDPDLRLSERVACEVCHLVPQGLRSAGHIDTDRPAEVFPDETTAGLAFSNEAEPVWDRAAATCTNTYCHGGGQSALRDRGPEIRRTLNWTASGTQQVFCGACHGIAPTTPPHLSSFTLEDCATCHPDTVDRFGNILFFEEDGIERSHHIDGIVDL